MELESCCVASSILDGHRHVLQQPAIMSRLAHVPYYHIFDCSEIGCPDNKGILSAWLKNGPRCTKWDRAKLSALALKFDKFLQRLDVWTGDGWVFYRSIGVV